MGATIARLIGGAGTGKTTELMRLMGKAIEAGDIGPDQIGFVSFTRAARAEAASRAADKFGCKVEELEQAGWFRTLHSVCYKCLQASGDEIITDDKASQKWIGDALQVPVEYGDGGSEEDGLGVVVGTPKSDAARALAIWHTARNRLASFQTVWNERRRQDDSLPPLDRCRVWVERYELHKTLDHRRDFTDLLGQFSGWRFLFDGPVRSTPQGSVPELPVWFFDEQQDTSPLLDSVCHRLIDTWACRWVYVSGDPFQAVYSFAGSDSKCFLSWPVAKEGIMPKSYRCPAPIHALGEKILKPCSDYFDRGIAPADHEGLVRREIDLRSVVKKIDPRESWLLIARTNFQAQRFANILNDEWIPWRPTTGYGGWQAPKRNLGMTAIMQLRDGWPIMPAEWKAALDLLPAKYAGEELLVRGTKSQWSKEGFAPSEELATLGTLHDWGATTRLKELIQHGGWSRIVEHGERYASAVRRFGTESLDNSGIKVGTVHCSPADEPVLTTEGYVPIANLDPARHKLASYDARTNRMTWGGRTGVGKTRDDQGFPFRMACNPYQGAMLTLETKTSRTRVTPTHRVRVKFAEKFVNKWVVYLMQRGNWWRVGVCTSGRMPYVSGGVGGRLATENADAGWILGVYESRTAALIGEATIQAKYGMPSLTFQAAKGRALSSLELHAIHSATEPFVAERARAMMRDLCLDENWPLYTRNGKVRLATAFETIAANVLSDYMLMPVPRSEFATRESPEWLTVRVTSEPFNGPVYSLEVLPFRHYVSGGAVVHNSVKGAEADNVILLTTTSSMIAKSQETQSGADEERRIGYVGITRARRQLVVVDELRERNKIEV